MSSENKQDLKPNPAEINLKVNEETLVNSFTKELALSKQYIPPI